MLNCIVIIEKRETSLWRRCILKCHRSRNAWWRMQNAKWLNACTNPTIHLFYPPPPQKKKNILRRHCFRLLLGHFHVPGEVANNGYANVLGGNRGVLWDCASSEYRKGKRSLHPPDPNDHPSSHWETICLPPVYLGSNEFMFSMN